MRRPAVGLTSGRHIEPIWLHVHPALTVAEQLLCLPVLIQVRIEITGHIVQLSSTTATLRNQIALHCRPESHIIRVGSIWQTVQNVPADHIRSDRKKRLFWFPLFL